VKLDLQHLQSYLRRYLERTLIAIIIKISTVIGAPNIDDIPIMVTPTAKETEVDSDGDNLQSAEYVAK
jgi:hypothetical protein